MSRIVCRKVGFVSFDSLPVNAVCDGADEQRADSPGGALDRMRHAASGRADAVDSRPMVSGAEQCAGDERLDADLKQLQDELYAEVSRLVGEAYGARGNRPPR